MIDIPFINLSIFSKNGRFAYLAKMTFGVICLILSVSLAIKFQSLFTILAAIACLAIFLSLLFRSYYSKYRKVKIMNGNVSSTRFMSIVYVNKQDFSDIKMPYQLLSLNKKFTESDLLYVFDVDASDYYELKIIHESLSIYRKNTVKMTNGIEYSGAMESIENFYGCNNRQLYNILNEHHKSMELSYMGAKKLACKLIKAQNTLQHHYSIKNTDTVSKGFHQIQKQSKNHDLKFYEDLKALINEEGIK